MKLNRTKQCAKCPWRKDSDPNDILNYIRDRHLQLKCTIAEDLSFDSPTIAAMACHESIEGKEDYCLGWLMNQLGPGNNIGLRLRMLRCENLGDVELVGEQHEKFEDTIR